MSTWKRSSIVPGEWSQLAVMFGMTNSPFEASNMYVRYRRSIHVQSMQLRRRHNAYWPVRLGRVRVVYTGFSEAEERSQVLSCCKSNRFKLGILIDSVSILPLRELSWFGIRLTFATAVGLSRWSRSEASFVDL
jgi:hypothetical protein